MCFLVEINILRVDRWHVNQQEMKQYRSMWRFWLPQRKNNMFGVLSLCMSNNNSQLTWAICLCHKKKAHSYLQMFALNDLRRTFCSLKDRSRSLVRITSHAALFFYRPAVHFDVIMIGEGLGCTQIPIKCYLVVNNALRKSALGLMTAMSQILRVPE